MLAHLKAALRWAADVNLLVKAPKIKMPKRAKGGKLMKGRAIAGEEFDRMIAKVVDVVGVPAAESWTHFLRGLWWSGLRLAESLDLWWDRDDRLCIDLAGKRPMLRIPGELEKGNKDRLLPVAPEFAEMLLATPVEERTGPVFIPAGGRSKSGRPSDWWVSRTVTAIGKKATSR